MSALFDRNLPYFCLLAAMRFTRSAAQVFAEGTCRLFLLFRASLRLLRLAAQFRILVIGEDLLAVGDSNGSLLLVDVGDRLENLVQLARASPAHSLYVR